MMDMDGEDEGEDVPIPDEDDEELDFLSDDSNKSDVSFSKMTARQRAAAIGDTNGELMELPSGEPSALIYAQLLLILTIFEFVQPRRRRRSSRQTKSRCARSRPLGGESISSTRSSRRRCVLSLHHASRQSIVC